MSHNLRTKTTNLFKLRQRHTPKQRHCNICNQKFHPHSIFDRYCTTCKEASEIYRFGEWLPELDETLTQKLSA